MKTKDRLKNKLVLLAESLVFSSISNNKTWFQFKTGSTTCLSGNGKGATTQEKDCCKQRQV